MLNTLTRKPWSQSVKSPPTEFSATSLPLLAGYIPDGLRGTLYRNGPARLERGGKRVGHWFDGDGAILAVHFTNDGASAVYRYVQTAGYQKEAEADRFLYANYGMTAPGPIWQRWGKKYKNNANTSVLGLPDKLLALWEAGHPHALDLQTLETWGTDNLVGLEPGDTFSAHPKIDPVTGDIYNFGVVAGKETLLKLYRSDRTGKILQKQATPLQGLSLIHDFVMAGPYLLFFVPPVRVNLLFALSKLKAIGDTFEWHPNLGTQVLIFDRQTLNLVAQNTVEPWFQWHYSNGYVQDGTIVIEFVHYQDFKTNQYLKEVPTGETRTPAKGTLYQIHLNPQTGKILETNQLVSRCCEFPNVSSHQIGTQHQNTYLLVHRENVDFSREIFGVPARYNHTTQSLSVANLEENCYASEPIFVRTPHSEAGWVLTVVYDGNSHTSEVRIYDSEHIEDEPIGRLGLPGIIPPGFHGTWQAANR